MTTELNPTEEEHEKPGMSRQGGGSNPVYGIGMMGAWIYFFRRATTQQERFQAFFKGIVWPAILVYELFQFLEKK